MSGFKKAAELYKVAEFGHIKFSKRPVDFMKKLVIIGHARHGKDTVAEFIHDLYGYQYKDSSRAAVEIFIFDKLKDKYGYNSIEQCYQDRVNHRAEWFDMICAYNKEDRARLAKDIMKHSQIYVGMRSDYELQECIRQGVFDLVVSVWNPDRELEPSSSFDIDLWKMSDIIIPNSGTLEDLKRRVIKLETLLKC